MSVVSSNPDAAAWISAYEKQERTLAHYQNFEYVNASAIAQNTRIRKVFIAFTHNQDQRGNFCRYKSRFAFPGNRLQTRYHYDPRDKGPWYRISHAWFSHRTVSHQSVDHHLITAPYTVFNQPASYAAVLTCSDAVYFGRPTGHRPIPRNST